MLERSTVNKKELITTKNGGREATDWEDGEIFELLELGQPGKRRFFINYFCVIKSDKRLDEGNKVGKGGTALNFP